MTMQVHCLRSLFLVSSADVLMNRAINQRRSPIKSIRCR